MNPYLFRRLRQQRKTRDYEGHTLSGYSHDARQATPGRGQAPAPPAPRRGAEPGWLPDDELTRRWLGYVADYRRQCDEADEFDAPAAVEPVAVLPADEALHHCHAEILDLILQSFGVPARLLRPDAR